MKDETGPDAIPSSGSHSDIVLRDLQILIFIYHKIFGLRMIPSHLRLCFLRFQAFLFSVRPRFFGSSPKCTFVNNSINVFLSFAVRFPRIHSSTLCNSLLASSHSFRPSSVSCTLRLLRSSSFTRLVSKCFSSRRCTIPRIFCWETPKIPSRFFMHSVCSSV